MNQFLFLLSRLFWLLPFGIIALIVVFTPEYVDVPPIIAQNSNQTNKWENDPKYFIHLSDIHINDYDTSSYDRFTHLMEISKSYKSDSLVITGDLADDCGNGAQPRYCTQNVKDFARYRKLMDNYKDEYKCIIDPPGNHDEFGVFSPHMSNYNKYSFLLKDDQTSFYGDENNFRVIRKRCENRTYLVMNPFRFPAGHPSTIYWIHPTEQFIAKLRDEIEKTPENEKIIFLCHYPMSMMFSDELKTVIANEKVELLLSGHIHVETPKIFHIGDAIEINGMSVFSEKICLITNDNGRVSMHIRSDIESEKKGVLITSPVPLELTTVNSGQNTFEDQRIRALVFSDDDGAEKIIKVRGSIEGTLNKIKEIKKGVYLYELPYHIEQEGIHDIEFYGDFTDTFSFYVGKKLTGLKEEVINDYKGVQAIYSIGLFLIPLFILMTLPCNIVIVSDEFCEKWYGLTILSFLSVRKRLFDLPFRHFKNLLFFFVLYPLFLPLVLIEIDGHQGALFSYGYVCNFVFVFAEWGQIYTLLYAVSVLLSIIIFSSSLDLKKMGSIKDIKIIDWIFLIGDGIVFPLAIILRWLVESAGWTRIWISVYTVAPIVLIGTLLYEFKKTTENYKLFEISVSSMTPTQMQPLLIS